MGLIVLAATMFIAMCAVTVSAIGIGTADKPASAVTTSAATVTVYKDAH